MRTIKLVPIVTACFVAYMFLAYAHAEQSGSSSAEPPAVISAASPWYPPAAYNVRASGEITVYVEIDASGTVSSAHAIGNPPLLKASEEAASRWKFVPDRKAGRRKAQLTFVYLLAKKAEEEVPPVFEPPYKVVVVHPLGRIL